MQKYAIIATLEIAPGSMEEYLTFLLEHKRRVLNEENNALQFEVLRVHNDKNKIMLFEVYKNKEAFINHWQGGSIIRHQEETKGMVRNISGISCTPIE